MENEEEIVSSAKVNGVIWITSLDEHERGVTNRIHDDLAFVFRAKNVSLEVFEPDSAQSLLRYLSDLAERARRDFKPIIHIDTHGNETDGIYIVGSKEFISWETAANAFREINAATGNNLCIISLACYGFHIAKHMPLEMPAPWYFLAAPVEEITADKIEQYAVPFYRELFDNLDLMGSFRPTFGRELRYLHSERWFFDVFTGYILNYCKGKAARERIERLVTEWKIAHSGASEKALKVARKTIKEGIKKPNAKALKRHADRFLMGKEYGFSIGDVRRHVEELQRRGKKAPSNPGQPA